MVEILKTLGMSEMDSEWLCSEMRYDEDDEDSTEWWNDEE